MPYLRRSIALTTTLALSCACTSVATEPVPGVEASTVQALIGDAACDSDAQCHAIAIGAKACGGPDRYLAWSSRSSDGTALQGAAERENRAARARVEKSGVMSNCAVVTDPGAYCASPQTGRGNAASTTAPPSSPARRCQLRLSGSGGAARIY